MAIRKGTKDEWRLFRRHHYLSHELHRSTEVFIGEIEGRAAAFCGIINFPHARVPNFKAVHRLVVLPDYQGLGFGVRLLDFTAELFRQKKKRVIITTGNPAMKCALAKNINWTLSRQGRVKPHGDSKLTGFKAHGSERRVTTAWEYQGPGT